MSGRSRAEVGTALGRSALSLVSLGLLLGAIPALLVSISRSRFGSANPLAGVDAPWGWTGADVTDGLGDPVSDDTVVDLVIRSSLCVAWIAVSIIAVTVVAEVVHLVRHRGLPLPDVRGLGWAQSVARFIAVGLVALLPLSTPQPTLALDDFGGRATSAPPRVDHDPSWSNASRPEAAMRPIGERRPTRPHVVRAGESVYSIAERIAGGDTGRTMEIAEAIVEANLGNAMGDGQRFTNPAYIEAGWTLEVPALHPAVANPPVASATEAPVRGREQLDHSEPAAAYVVERGDTLWDIADEQLGDPTAWTDIWERHAGTEMPDGRTFDDPDLILPGWELDLGADQGDDGTAEPVTAGNEPAATVVEPDTSDEPPPDRDKAGADASAATTSTNPWTNPSTTDPPTTPATTTPATTTPPTTAPARSAPPVATVSPSTTSMSSTVPTPGPPAGGEQLVQGGVAPEAPSPIRIEHAALVAAGILALVGVRRRQRLRAARPRTRVPEPMRDVVITERSLRTVDPGERAARLDVACRAVGYALIGTGAQIGWVVMSGEGAIGVRLTAAATLPPPWTGEGNEWQLPAEVPVELLSDHARQVGDPCATLVQLGVTDDGGDLLVDLEACGVLAVEGAPRSTDDVVTALATALASSLHAETTHLIAASLDHRALLGHRNAHVVDRTQEAMELAASLVGSTAGQERSTFELRSLRTGGEAWEPAVVLLTTTDASIDESTPLPKPGHGVAVIAPAAPGTLRHAPTRLIGRTFGWVLEAFGSSIELTPIGLSPAQLADVDAVVATAREPLVPVDELRWVDDGDDDPGTDDGADDDGPRDDEPATTAPATVDEFVPKPHEIVVGLLGAVTITDLDGTPASFERSKTVELIAWLATHRERATRTGARTALWELDVRDATFANVVSEARRALARLVPPPDDEEWVARTLNEQLPLHPGVVTDAQLVEQRLVHARLQPPRPAMATLRPAVESIRDMPFAGTSYLWPDAEGITSNLVLLAISASAEYAAHALSVGDIDGVFWATGRGLQVLPGHEELIGLRMRAHARSGDLAGVRAEWESYERVIVADAWSDGEPAPKLLELRRTLLSPADTP